MQSIHVKALGLALAAARVDEVAAVQGLLQVVLDATSADEARLMVLQDGAVEIWRLALGGDVTLAVALDGSDDGFADWRQRVALDADRVLLTASLPLAPGVDAGLLAVDVSSHPLFADEAASQLDLLALHAASVAAVGRADLERRIAVSAATNDDKLVKARQQANNLRLRAESATSALHLAEQDGSFRQDAAAHLEALTAIVDDLVKDLGGQAV